VRTARRTFSRAGALCGGAGKVTVCVISGLARLTEERRDERLP
jgi:hypothetical protein